MFTSAILQEHAEAQPVPPAGPVAIASLTPSEHEDWGDAMRHVREGQCCNGGEEDDAANAAIRAAVAAGQELDSILAHWPSRRVLDGHHRCAISLESGRDYIPVEWTTDLPE